jgi:hypothetical protein
MPTLSRFFGIVITMNWDDHPPPQRALALVVEWAVLHRAELWDNWDRVHAARPIQPIAPLE